MLSRLDPPIGRDDHDCPPFVSDCHVRLATDLIAHTWDPVVLMALRRGPRRRSELLAEIGGVSDKVLADALRRVLASGLVARGDRYALTPLGESFVEGPLAALAQWAVDRGDEVRA